MANTTSVFAARRNGLRKFALATSLVCCTALTSPAFAEDADPAAPAAPADGEIVVTGSLDALPVKGVGSVFGFDKTLVETPRSASSVSSEQIERFGATDIYDLVAQAPGTFTNSFFGIGGALDIRGTPGEVYFRGMRRLDNPGNYPTPIGASDRIDIVRGPASPIYGPSKTGGYMNFVPKTARVGKGSYLAEPQGDITYTRGSWNQNILSASIMGPGKIGEQEFGYSLYGEVEDSDSYYRYMFTKQTILQASFDTDLSDKVRIEFGGMYQNYHGIQNGGWNRVTQDLIDNGTYITGTAQPLDGVDGSTSDGQISQSEINAAGGLTNFGSFVCGGGIYASGLTNSCLTTNLPQLGLQNTGTTKLSRRDVLAGKNDKVDNIAKTFYFDTIFNSGGWEIKNQFFYDGYTNQNENAYGFSQFHDSWVIENKIVAAKTFDTGMGKLSLQLSPSIRYTRFKHGDDFNYEYFDRVDLTQSYTPLSDRLLSTECNCDYTNYLKGHYTDYSIAGLTDLDFNFGLDLTLGARYDWIKVNSTYVPSMMESAPDVVSATGSKGAFSWSASASYKLPFGLIPYVTAARQSTVVAGQGAEIYPENVAGNAFVSASKLYEGGIKGSWLDGRLYAALSVYKQKRTDFNIQSLTVNQAVQTTGLEAETRWSVNKHLLVTAAYTRTTVKNLTFLHDGQFFYFYGIDYLSQFGLDPANYLGGALIGYIPLTSKSQANRPGIPKNLYSATATYSFDNGISLSGDISRVPAVWSDYAHTVRLPAYTMVDLGASYETGPFLFRLVVKNALNEKYFRANFVELFASQVVLPEKPRSFQASIKYKF